MLALRHTDDAEGGMHEGGMHESGVDDEDKAGRDACTKGDAENGITDEAVAGEEACADTEMDSKTKAKKAKAPHKGGDTGIEPKEGGVQQVLRLNNERVHKKDGTPRPKDYILAQLKAVEGKSVDEAVGTRHKDTKGVLKPYRKKDLNYNVE